MGPERFITFRRQWLIMRPAVIGFALAVAFLAIIKIKPPLLYIALLVPVAMAVYGFISEELPTRPKSEDEPGDSDEDSWFFW